MTDKPNRADLIAEVRAVYTDLQARPVERGCRSLAQCCHFKRTGKTPFLTAGEAIVAAMGVRASGRKTLPDSVDGTCPLLSGTTGRCVIYQDRPFGCRTHFCAQAGGVVPRDAVIDLIRRLEIVDAQLGGVGPRALPGAIDEAMGKLKSRH